MGPPSCMFSPLKTVSDHPFQSKWIPTVPTWKEAAFAGYFGPIGVGAVYYTQVALEFLPDNGSRDRLRA